MKNELLVLPDFLIIGAMKGGTTTLHETLLVHPQIGMSHFKEPNFFSKEFNKGLNWYANMFDKNKSINGEASPSYSMRGNYPLTVSRIKETLKEPRIIYILRDPIDRIISHLQHNLYRDRLRLSEVEFKLFDDPQYIDYSRYYFQISPYLKSFGKENILYLEMETLKNNPNKLFGEICNFLNVDKFDFSNSINVSNQTSKRYLIKYHDKAHQILPKKLSKIYHWFFYFFNIKIQKPELDLATKRKLKSKLEDDVERLKIITGKQFSNWKSYNSL